MRESAQGPVKVIAQNWELIIASIVHAAEDERETIMNFSLERFEKWG